MDIKAFDKFIYTFYMKIEGSSNLVYCNDLSMCTEYKITYRRDIKLTNMHLKG